MSQALPLPVHHASRRLHRMINGKVTNILYLFLTFMGKKKKLRNPLNQKNKKNNLKKTD